jgi:hypothetical protein
MKLKPTQIIGLVAIVVFGGILVTTLLRPKPDPYSLPNGMPFSSLPSPTAPDFEIPIPDLQYTIPPAPGGDARPAVSAPAAPVVIYTAIGSQDARDDLYCDAALNAEFDKVVRTGHPDASAALLREASQLRGAGLAKLKAEGASAGDDWAFFTSAYSDLATADHAAGRLRIAVAACKARAAALPADSPPPP